MCFETVLMSVNDERVFEGYKIFIERDGKLFNWNTGKVPYENNFWYTAVDKDIDVGSHYKDYKHGFHFFLTEDDAGRYSRIGSPARGGIIVLKKVNLKEILSIGTNGGIINCCAKYMLIPQDKLTISQLKAGQRFIFTQECNLEFVLVSPHADLIVKDGEEKVKYCYIDSKNHLYARSEDDEVQLVKE